MMPVYMGRMGVAARIYATVLSMMMLILLAMHFYLQDWSQKQAEAWVGSWEQTYHAHVGQVNLHMLRGALKLKHVHWQSDDVMLDIPVVLLHGEFTGVSEQTHIIDMTIHEPTLQFSQAWMQDTWKHQNTLLSQEPWSSMLTSLHALHIKGLHTSFLASNEVFPVLNCQWSDMPRAWSCDGRNQHGGTLHIKTSKQSGHASWTGMQDDVWMQIFSAPSQAGVWQGQADWSAHQVSGKMTWISDDASVKQGHWVWHGKKEADVWQTRLYLKHAPLHGLAHKIPQLFGQTWQQGFATGNVDIINDVMTADELTLEDVSFQGKDAAYLGLNELQLSHIQFDTYAQIFKAKSMDIQDGVWHFD
ncbi:MAG: hypothetical protein Q9M18_00250, partial [Mariprofundaceae bacterium]|nr:hypothetical protein [Mariprofundaceae bacterium]